MYVYLKQEYRRWGKPIKQLGPDAEAVMKDMKTDINISHCVRSQTQELDLIAKNSNEKEELPISILSLVESPRNLTAVLNEGGAMPKLVQSPLMRLSPTPLV